VRPPAATSRGCFQPCFAPAWPPIAPTKRKIKAFIRSFGTLGKTDAIDARARYAQDRGRDLPLWRARDEKRVNLQTFVLARRDLVADRLAYRNRRDAPNAGPLRAHYDSLLREFEARIEALDAEIKTLIEACEPVARTVKALVAIPGIGLKTAAALVGLLPELGSASPKRIASLAGLALHPNQSGAADRHRFVRGDRWLIRRSGPLNDLRFRRHQIAEPATGATRTARSGLRSCAMLT
jgi:transposase